MNFRGFFYIHSMTLSQKQDLLKYLYNFLSENKMNLFEKIITDRTKHVTIALENIESRRTQSQVQVNEMKVE